MHESLRINAKKLTEMKTFEVQHIFRYARRPLDNAVVG